MCSLSNLGHVDQICEPYSTQVWCLPDAWDFTVNFIYSLFINQIIWHVIHDVHMSVQAYRPMHEEGGQRKMSGVQLYHWAPYSLDAHKTGS